MCFKIYFGYEPFVRCVIGKYFIPFCRLSFRFVDGFFVQNSCQFDIVLLFSFCFRCKSTCLFLLLVIHVEELPACVFFWAFYGSGSSVKSLIHFELVFVFSVRQWASCILLHGTVQFSHHHFEQTVLSLWLLCCILNDHMRMGLFLAPYSDPFILCVCLYDIAILV